MRRYAAFAAALAMIAAPAMAYQVTGPVLELTDNKIVVEKDKEKWEIARDKDTRVKGDLRKGSRVTIQYKMTATSIDVRDAAKDTRKEAKDTKKEPRPPSSK